MNELVGKVQQWSIARGLDEADSLGQFLKIVEEVGEVSAELARNNMEKLKTEIGDLVVTLIIFSQQCCFDIDYDNYNYHSNACGHPALFMTEITHEVSNILLEDYMEDSTGMIIQYLHDLSYKFNFTLEQCLQSAYDKIKDRKGKLINGVWVKSDDINNSEDDKSAWEQHTDMKS